MESVPLLAWCTSLEGKGGTRVDMYICVSIYCMYIICILFTGVGQCQMCLQKICYDPAFRYLLIYLCFQLSFTVVNSLAMFLLTWPPWHPSPSQRLSSAHNLASRIGRSMRSVSSWRSKEPWNTCQARFVDHFFFNNVGVVWRSRSFASVLELLRGFWRVVPVSQDDGSSAWVR